MSKREEMVVRINSLMGSKRMQIKKLAELTSTPPTSVSQYLGGGRKMPADFILNILDAFPELSAEWLMRGRGDMYQTSNSQSVIIGDVTGATASVNSNVQTMPDYVKDILEDYRSHIKSLQEQINALKK